MSQLTSLSGFSEFCSVEQFKQAAGTVQLARTYVDSFGSVVKPEGKRGTTLDMLHDYQPELIRRCNSEVHLHAGLFCAAPIGTQQYRTISAGL